MKLPKELKQKVDAAIIDRVREAVADNADRDARLAGLANRLEGNASPGTINQRWKNACRLEDPLTREHHLQLLSTMTQAWRTQQFWMCDAVDPSDAEAARAVETYMNIRARQYGLAQAMYDCAFNALTYTFAPMYVGWKTYQKYVRVAQWRNLETGETVETPEEGADPEQWERVIRRVPADAYNGLIFKSVDPLDFYLWPATAQDPETAPAIIERVRVHAEDIVRDYPPELAYKVLRAGPDRDTDRRDEVNDDDGLVPSSGEGGTYILYVVTGTAPLLLELGEPTLPEELALEEYTWVVHQGSETVLSMEAATTVMRPYVCFNALRMPNRLQGHGIVTLVQSLQDEATANLRFTIDSMNLAASPAMKVPERWMNKYGKWAMYPGALVPYIGSPDEITPLTWDMRGVAAGMQLANYIDSRASRIASAQGLSSMLAGKVRKAAEVNATVGVVEQKSDLFLQCMQDGLEHVGELVLSIYMDKMGEDGDVILGDLGPVAVTPSDLRKRLRIHATATSEDSNSETRAQKTLARRKVQSEYFATLNQTPPYQWSAAWASARQALVDLGERAPDEWLGPRPPQSAPPWIAPQTATQQTAPALTGMGVGPVAPEGTMGGPPPNEEIGLGR